METITLIALIGLLMLVSYDIGAKKGSKIDNRIKSPVELIKEAKKNKEQREMEQLNKEIEEINMHNIEVYDGTSIGQKSFPGR
jgi:uncharacterized membrane protein (DUF106 family)